MFVDRAKIYLKAGDGGNGCLSFRREKFVPRGGPNGGNGGKGGDIIFQATQHLNTLLGFRYNQHFKAKRGAHGSGNNRQGRSGEDLVIEVPAGTQIRNAETDELIEDLTEPGQTVKILSGGRGGRGNAAFAGPTNQAPRTVEDGAPGEELTVVLELKVLADAGLIGYPNAGKSTLISVVSAARPKIADYPFTTLTPSLGVVTYDDYKTIVIADIPGLIQGAHQGSGLGDQFLRHIERCKVLVHLIDVSDAGPQDPIEALTAVNQELALYDPELRNRKQVIAPSKMDAADTKRLETLVRYCKTKGWTCCPVSSVSGQGIAELTKAILDVVEEAE